MIQEWERVNTPEGRPGLIHDLFVLQDSIHSFIDEYNENKVSNERIFYMSLPINRQHIDYLMSTVINSLLAHLK